MKKAIATAIISALSLSMLVSCGSTSESSENGSERSSNTTAASKTASETTSLSAEKIKLPDEEQTTQSKTKSSSQKNSKTSSDKNRNSENVTFPGEIDLSDGNAAMDLEKKKRGIKPDDDGFIIDDGILYDYDGTDPEVYIPDDVTRIEARAFWGNDVVEAVYIPSSVEYIGDSAFWSCGALRYVEIEDGMKKISDRAFWSCSALKDVIIPESVTTIGSTAFWSIPELTIHAPKGSVAESFAKSNRISYSAGEAEYEKLDTENIIRARQYEHADFSEFTIPENITSIESEAFQYCRKLKTITIPANVKYIAPNAFEYCEGLETVIIDGCPEIKAEAFEYCSNLKTLIINDGCKSIGESAFAYCENLNDIYIAASVDKIDKRAFEYIGENPVFHAPSGSKAERYANSMSYAHDNNI